jgi:hypothetical protein
LVLVLVLDSVLVLVLVLVILREPLPFWFLSINLQTICQGAGRLALWPWNRIWDWSDLVYLLFASQSFVLDGSRHLPSGEMERYRINQEFPPGRFCFYLCVRFISYLRFMPLLNSLN